MRIKAILAPIAMSKNKFSSSRFAAAAMGPGVGGTRTCGAKSPVYKATVRPTNWVLVCLDMVLFKLDKITKAASQKTGIDTK